VADCLSQYYESNTTSNVHDTLEYVQADRKVDPEGEGLSQEQMQKQEESSQDKGHASYRTET
jgi:hypothetical protein